MVTIDWGQILSNLGIFGLITGAITWLLKNLGQDLIARRFKAYEKELDIKSKEFQSELDADLETHKAKLEIEHTQYLKLHEKRLEIMVELYKKIAELDRKMHIMTAIMKPIPYGVDPNKMEQEQINAASTAYHDFQTFYLDNKIFFNADTCKIIDSLRALYWDSWWDGTMRQRLSVSDFKFNYESAKKASETVKNSIPTVTAKLEDEFRKILGVS